MATRRAQTYLSSIYVAIGQHHGRVVLVHGLAGEGADEVGLGAVGEGKGAG